MNWGQCWGYLATTNCLLIAQMELLVAFSETVGAEVIVIFTWLDCAVVVVKQVAFEVNTQYTLVLAETLLSVSDEPVPEATPPTYH